MDGDEAQEGLTRRIAAEPDARIEGADRSGAVTVAVDVNEQVVGVSLSTDWRRLFGPKRLGGAILEAKDAASAHYAVLRLTGEESGEGSVLSPLVVEESRQGDIQLSIEDMAGLLFDYGVERDAYLRDQRSLYTNDREITDPTGWVTARVRGAAVVSIEFDPNGFPALSAVTIESAVVWLYAEAQRTLDAAENNLLLRYPAISRLLTRSPL